MVAALEPSYTGTHAGRDEIVVGGGTGVLTTCTALHFNHGPFFVYDYKIAPLLVLKSLSMRKEGSSL